MKQRVFQRDVSLNQPVQLGSTKSLLDLQADKSASFEESFSDLRQAQRLKEALKEMEGEFTEREKNILSRRLLKSPPDTLQDIADTFQVTREAIRQAEERLMEKLRKKLIPLLKSAL